jgi:hypothetical protein
VAEGQAEDYARHNPGVPILTHPDTLIGLAPKRQWIYDRLGDVFMVDDDVAFFRALYLPRHSPRLSPANAYELIQATAETARNLGAFLFGFTGNGDSRTYFPQQPFGLVGFCNGCALGLLAGSKIRFPPEAVAVEDVFASGINAYYHRYAFFDRRFGVIQKKTFRNPGGQSEYRTVERERESLEYLQRMFGDAIRRKKTTNKFGEIRKVSSAFERMLVIPF